MANALGGLKSQRENAAARVTAPALKIWVIRSRNLFMVL